MRSNRVGAIAVSTPTDYFLKQMRVAQVESIIIQKALDGALVQELSPDYAPLGRATSLVAILSISGEAYRKAASPGGAEVFLLKDLYIAELLAAIRECLQGDCLMSN